MQVRHAVVKWLLNNGSIVAKSYVARFEVLIAVLLKVSHQECYAMPLGKMQPSLERNLSVAW
jgi:hypothetical protein